MRFFASFLQSPVTCGAGAGLDWQSPGSLLSPVEWLCGARPIAYEASARVYVDTQTVLKPLMAGLAVQPNIDEQIGMLARTIIARPNIEKIMHSANLDVSATSQIERDQMVDALTKRIRFTSSGLENIYTISYQDTNPDRSKRVVQDLLSLFVESGLGNKRRDSVSARRFIDEQIKGYEQKLAEAENRLKEFKLKNMEFTSGTGQDYFTRMSLLSEEATKVRAELRVSRTDARRLRRELAGEDPVMLPDAQRERHRAAPVRRNTTRASTHNASSSTNCCAVSPTSIPTLLQPAD